MKHIDTEVKKCDMTKCCYNTDNACHAGAISVGDTTPSCDTYCSYGKKGGDPKIHATVGACKVESCTHNESLMCAAQNITVRGFENYAECGTYSSR